MVRRKRDELNYGMALCRHIAPVRYCRVPSGTCDSPLGQSRVILALQGQFHYATQYTLYVQPSMTLTSITIVH